MNLKRPIYYRHGLCIMLGLIPLSFPLGRNLEYEYSLGLNLLLIVLALGSHVWRGPGVQQYLPPSFYLSGLISLMLPACLWRLSQACLCSPREIALWLLVTVVPAWFLALGIATSQDRLRGWSIRYRRLTQMGVLALLVLYPLLELWVMPQKRSTSLLLGFLHGPIYDRWIPLDWGILIKRSLHGFIGISLILWARQYPKLVKVDGPLVVGLLLINGLLYSFPSQGHGYGALKKHLPDTFEGNGIVMHYRKSARASVNLQYKRVYQQALFHLKDLSTYFIDPPYVHLLVYGNSDDKKLLFGGGGTDVTDVFSPSIHINLASWPHPTLRHELVHALGSGNGFHGLGFHPNMAFTEGLAVALAPTARSLSLDSSVKELAKMDKVPDLDLLFSPFFWVFAGPRAYPTAGSFIQYLGKQYGFQKVTRLYNGEDWEDIFPVSRDGIAAGWMQYIRSLPSTEDRGLYSEALFRYPGLIHDICPHSKATLSQISSQPLLPSWRQPSPWTWLNYWQWRQALEPESPSITYRIFYTKAKAAIESNNSELIRTLIDKIPSQVQEIKFLEDFSLILLKADLLFWLQEDDEPLLNQLADFQKQKFLGLSNFRHTFLRKELAQQQNQRDLRLYLAGFQSWKTISKNTSNWVYRYLAIKSQALIPETSLSSLAEQGLPAHLPSSLQFEFHHKLAQRFANQELWLSARHQMTLAQPYAPEGTRAALDLWMKELKFLSHSTLP